MENCRCLTTNEKDPGQGKNDLFDTVTRNTLVLRCHHGKVFLTEEQRIQVLSYVTTLLVKDRNLWINSPKARRFSTRDDQAKGY